MADYQPIKVTTELRSDPNLRKLARALIALARQELKQASEAREAEDSDRGAA